MKKVIALTILFLAFIVGTAVTSYSQTRYEYQCRNVIYGARIYRQCGYVPVYRNYGQWRREHNRNRRWNRDRRYDDRDYRRYDRRNRNGVQFRVRIGH